MKIFLSLCCMVLIKLNSCGPPPFPGGVRSLADEAMVDSPDNRVGVAGVNDIGTVLSVVGTGNGTLQSFNGFTDDNGIDDHPNARDNANWSDFFNWSFSEEPSCPTTTSTGYIPVGGGEFEKTCLL